MKNIRTALGPFFASLCLILFFALTSTASSAASVHFKIALDAAVAGADPVSGRLLIFMTRSDKPQEMIGPDFTDPNAVYISGTEVANLVPGKPVDIDSDALAFPGPFSSAPAGDYQIFALLDRDHSYTYGGKGPGDIYSVVTKSPMPSGETVITLS